MSNGRSERHTSTSKPRVNARTKSAARCSAPTSVVSLHVCIISQQLLNEAANRNKEKPKKGTLAVIVSFLQLNGSVKEPNKFHNYETEKVTRKASDAAEYIELFGSFTRDRHVRHI